MQKTSKFNTEEYDLGNSKIPEETTMDEIQLINRWEKWNKMALINTRGAIKKSNADLKILNLEKDLIRNIKKKFKS